MRAASALATVLRQCGCRFTPAYTATNQPGVELAAHAGGAGAIAALAPWDHPRWVAHALDRWQPLGLFLIETELWPSLILEASRRNVPVFCVSARIYPRDFARYRLIRSLTVPMLRRVTAVLAQNETERDRLVALGADPDRCSVAGNLKYVGAGVTCTSATTSWRHELGLRSDEQVVVFGSIHADEVGTIFAALEQLPDGYAPCASSHPGMARRSRRSSAKRAGGAGTFTCEPRGRHHRTGRFLCSTAWVNWPLHMLWHPWPSSEVALGSMVVITR